MRHPILAALAAFAGALALTWALLERPWDPLVPYQPDPAAAQADLQVLSRAMATLPAPRPTGERRDPDVVLIVLDTLRADHLDLYGYPHETAPHLARWSKDARVWTRALSTSAWTLPAHASLFTGLPTRVHGAEGSLLTDQDLADKRKLRRLLHSPRENPLSDQASTVAERLRERGFRTVGIAANQAFLQKYWNLDQGFDVYLCDQLGMGRDGLPYIRGDRITDLALAAVDQVRALAPRSSEEAPSRQPLFLFLNYMDTHGPYVPREGFVRDPSALSLLFRSGSQRDRIARRVLVQERTLPNDVRDAWIEAYDAEIRFVDAQVGRLLAGLRERGLGDDALITIVGDHGEYFGEHYLLAHSKDVYQPVLQIPFLARGPGIPPGQVDDPVQLDDWLSLLSSWLGDEPPPSPRPPDLQVAEIQGSRSLDLRKPRMRERFNRVRRAFVEGDHKIILGSDGSFEAYDLSDDPGELRDLHTEPWAVELQSRALTWVASTPERPWGDARKKGRKLDSSITERLKELGYVD